jgi:chromosome segregation ATPase
VQKEISAAQTRAAEANERTAKLQEEIGKTQQKILDAQALTAQYTHALVNQQKATAQIQSKHAQINALSSLLVTRQIALQQFVMPNEHKLPEPTVS